MFCTNCGKEVKDNTNFCPGCGKEIRKIPTASTANVKPIATPTITKDDSFKYISIIYTVSILICLIMNIEIELVKYVERGFSIEEVCRKVIGHNIGYIFAIIILATSGWMKNKYTIKGSIIKNGIIGIVSSYIILLIYGFYQVIEYPMTSGIDTYNRMFEEVKIFKIIKWILIIFMFLYPVYCKVAKDQEIVDNKNTTVSIPILFGAIGSIPVMFYIFSAML